MKIGVDIGGTFIKIGLINSANKVLYYNSVHINNNISLFDNIKDIIYILINYNKNISISDISLIGLGIPGLIDYNSQKIVKIANQISSIYNDSFLDNLLNYYNQYNISVVIDNDVSNILKGEVRFNRQLSNSSNILLIALGTGVGSSLYLNSRLYRGTRFGMDIAHIVVSYDNKNKCVCGKYGCLESYLGSYALVKDFNQLYNTSYDTKTFYRMYISKDIKVYNFVCKRLYLLEDFCSNIINMLNLDTIIITGGGNIIINNLSNFIENINMKVLPSLNGTCKIMKSNYYNYYNVLGAIS